MRNECTRAQPPPKAIALCARPRTESGQTGAASEAARCEHLLRTTHGKTESCDPSCASSPRAPSRPDLETRIPVLMSSLARAHVTASRSIQAATGGIPSRYIAPTTTPRTLLTPTATRSLWGGSLPSHRIRMQDRRDKQREPHDAAGARSQSTTTVPPMASTPPAPRPYGQPDGFGSSTGAAEYSPGTLSQQQYHQQAQRRPYESAQAAQPAGPEPGVAHEE